MNKLYIAGHKGMVGSSILRNLKGNFKSVTSNFDLTDKEKVNEFFLKERPNYVILAAARVGGICANNTYPADFFYINISIQNNIIKACLDYKVKRLIFLGSSCIYPKNCKQPIVEESLMTGLLEETNKAYAIAKIAGIGYCTACNKQYGTDFISIMPCNLYGPNDNYSLNDSHVIPGIIRKMHIAKINKHTSVTLWGNGEPLREFMYVDDLANACIFLLSQEKVPEIINVGSGEEISIKNLAENIKYIVDFKGKILWNNIKYLNGTPRKVLDSSKINKLGWHSEFKLGSGLFETYRLFKKDNVRISHNY